MDEFLWRAEKKASKDKGKQEEEIKTRNPGKGRTLQRHSWDKRTSESPDLADRTDGWEARTHHE